MTTSFTEAVRSKYRYEEEENDANQNDGYIRNLVSNRPRSGTQGAELGYLTSVVLSNYKIEHIIVSQESISRLCPNVVDLDLSENFIANWGQVMSLVSCLPRLKCLNLTENRFKPYKNEITWPEGRPSSKLETLVLNSTGISWRDAVILGGILPQLKELHLDHNDYWKITVTAEELKTSFSNLELLTLTRNYLKRWEEINKLKDLPSLKTLNLSSNPLQNITTSLTPPSPRKPTSPRKSTSPRNFARRVPNQSNSGIAYSSKRLRHGSTSPPPATKRSLSFDPDDRQLPALSRRQSQEAISGHLSCSPESDVMSSSSDEGGVSPREVNDSVIEEVMDEILAFVISDVDRPKTETHAEIDLEGLNDSAKKDETWDGFQNLHSLWINSTNVSDWSDVEALRKFSSMRSLRIHDSAFLKNFPADVRRKLLVASLPNIENLNGSEVNGIEREKSEIFYVKFVSQESVKPERYHELVKRYGNLRPDNEVDLGRGFQEYATLSFVYGGRSITRESIHLIQTVGKLKLFCSRLTNIPSRNVKLYHFSKRFESDQQDYQELFLESLPLSRFDMTDGDEIHIDVDANGGIKFASLG